MSEKQQKQQQQQREQRAPMVPSVTLPGIGTLTLSPDHGEITLSKRDAAALGRETVKVLAWGTLSEKSREVVIGEDEETGDAVTALLSRVRHCVTIPRPLDADGSPLPLPSTATVEGFGEQKTIALGSFPRKARTLKDGSVKRPEPIAAGMVEYGRPSGAVYGFAVKVVAITAADGSPALRVGATLAQ